MFVSQVLLIIPLDAGVRTGRLCTAPLQVRGHQRFYFVRRHQGSAKFINQAYLDDLLSLKQRLCTVPNRIRSKRSSVCLEYDHRQHTETRRYVMIPGISLSASPMSPGNYRKACAFSAANSAEGVEPAVETQRGTLKREPRLHLY